MMRIVPMAHLHVQTRVPKSLARLPAEQRQFGCRKPALMAPVAMFSLLAVPIVMVAVAPAAARFNDATGEGERKQQ